MGWRIIKKRGLIILLVIIILFFFDPIEHTWYPKCFFYQITGFECPSCGTQRAFHSMLHGDFKKAFDYNPFLFFVLPYILGLLFSKLSTRKWTDIIYQKLSQPKLVYAYVVFYFLWWIIRNII